MADPVSPALLAKLPRTFAPALNEQLRSWDLLFPAERRAISAQMDWLGRLPDAEFRALFEPIAALEKRMDLPPWKPSTDRLSVNDTGILVRSPYYQQWRAEVEKVFTKIDAAREAEGGWKRANKLIVCAMPAGVPTPSGPLWKQLEAQGKWVPVESPFADVLPVLFRGVAERDEAPGIEPVERTWVFEYDPQLSSIHVNGPVAGFSFEELGPVRREFLVRLNIISRDLRTLDRTYDDLRRLDLSRLLAQRYSAGVREFVRSLFLSGNGALLFGNSFVQWGASEAFRRAAPQAMFCRFGIRPKLKPFSSVVLFEDQNRANPVPDQPDPEGSFVDARLLVEYVYLAALRGPEYADHALVLLAVPEQKRVLVLGPAAAMASLAGGGPPVRAPELVSAARAWLAAKTQA
ncbi:MAG: hypothetical protein ABSH47_05270 [Bryobacteraceae bacterium]|jgi:hypothetical protein